MTSFTLYGSGYEKPDEFAFMSNPILHIFPQEYFQNQTGIKDSGKFWEAKDIANARRVSDFLTNRKGDFLTTTEYNFMTSNAQEQLFNNQVAWKNLGNILDRGGFVLSFDTETIGDFSANEINTIESRVAGITEIGFVIDKYKGKGSSGPGFKNPKGSFVFGIDSEQKEWLESVLEKMKKGETLSEIEEVAMERMSRYSTLGDNAFSVFQDTYTTGSIAEKNKKTLTYNFVKNINESRPNDIMHIESGIEALSKLYTEDRDERIQNLINHLNKFGSNLNEHLNHSVIGQNLLFDINVINKYADAHNLEGLSENFKFADSLYALQAYAEANNTTVGSIIKELNPSVSNPRLSSLEAITEAITDSSGYTQFLAHNAFEDSVATARVFKNRDLKITERALGILNNLNNSPNKINLENNYIKINSRGNIRSNDFILIDNKLAESYQVSNQYWKFSGHGWTNFRGFEYEKKRLINTSNRFVMRFDSVNGDNAKLIKTFDSISEANEFLRNNTSIVSPFEANIELQTKIHDDDIARRTINAFFETNQNGFDNFQKYYGVYKELSNMSDDVVSSMHLIDYSGNEIKTASEWMSNLGADLNFETLIDYGDKHQNSKIYNYFRSSKRNQNIDVDALAIRKYDERKRMQEVFKVFKENEDFFDFADKNISKIDNEILRTITFREARDLAFKQKQDIEHKVQYTIDDLNTVSITNKNGSLSRINVSDINKGSYQLRSALGTFKDNDTLKTQRLYNVVKELQSNNLLDDDLDLAQFSKSKPAYIADEIVKELNKSTEKIRELGVDFSERIINDYLYDDYTIQELADREGIEAKEIQKIINKHNKSLLESAQSDLFNKKAVMTDEIRQSIMNNVAHSANKDKVFFNSTAGFDTGINEEFSTNRGIANTLESMGYAKSDIESFQAMFYTNLSEAKKKKTKSNIPALNERLGFAGTDREVETLFYRSGADEASAFLVLTNKKNYNKVADALHSLDNNSTDTQVKKALEKIAMYHRIPYLKQVELDREEGHIIKEITGHNPKVTLVKQGDNSWKYDVMSFNVFEKDGKLTGRFQDQGGSYLTSSRYHMISAMKNVADDNFDAAIRSSNKNNIARLAEEATPQIGGSFDVHGNFVRNTNSGLASAKDIDFAHIIDLEPEEEDKSLKYLFKDIVSDQNIYAKLDPKKNAKEIETINAFRGIVTALDEYNDTFNPKSINRVMNSEQFKQFYARNISGQIGGIGQEILIQNFISMNPNSPEAKALKAYSDKGLITLLKDATTVSDKYSSELTGNLALLEGNINSVGSESMMHHSLFYLGLNGPQEYNNNRTSAITRPTYAQRSNYRAYRLDGNYFTDYKQLEKNLGIHFGDIYSPDQFEKDIGKIDKAYLKAAGVTPSEETISRRSIIGAVSSISDTELQAQRGVALDYLIKNKGELDEDVLENMFNRIMNDINLYEGKAYMRPSLANQTFFTMGDPKNIVSNEIRSIFEYGSKEEKEQTSYALKQLIGKELKNGSTLGYRKNNSGGMSPVIYNGQTVHEFTSRNAEELMQNGKTLAVVENQLDSGKIMFDEEKGTFETLRYFSSLDKETQLKETKNLLLDLGFYEGDINDTSKLNIVNNTLEENVKILDTYSDAVFNALNFNNDSKYKTIVMANNNVVKHLTDTSISSKWNIIMSEYNSKEGFEKLKDLIGTTKIHDNSKKTAIEFPDGSMLADHLDFDELRGITFNNPTDTGSVNVLDAVIQRLRESGTDESKHILETIDKFNKSNTALLSIQRQQMNPFQAQNFKIDQRVYQALVMQGEGNYTRGDGAKLAETIRERIESGYYDKSDNISRIGAKSKIKKLNKNTWAIDKTWASIVKSRRGQLKPKQAEDMFFGLFDTSLFLNGNLDVNNANIVQFNAKDILQQIPEEGGNTEKYTNFIFKTGPGEKGYTEFIRGRANIGKNNVDLNAKSHSFYLDLSDFGEFELKGFKDKKFTGMVLPYQYITHSDEDMYANKVTTETIHFFNQLKKAESQTSQKSHQTITDALNNLLEVYEAELDTSDKNSLATKAFYKLKMPGSAGALAKDAIVPVLDTTTGDFSYNDLRNIKELEWKISEDMDQYGFSRIDREDVKSYIESKVKESEAIKAQQKRILKSKNPVEELKLTSGNKKYQQYIKGFGENAGLIESAVTVSKDMFYNTEMDLGRIGDEILTDYFRGSKAGITKYDSLSRFHINELGQIDYVAGEFKLNKTDLLDITNNLENTFKDTRHQSWAEKTANELRDILEQGTSKGREGSAAKYSSQFEKQKDFVDTLHKRINQHIKNDEIGINLKDAQNLVNNSLEIERRNFLLKTNKIYEGLGERYATEVGVLAYVNRYPDFTAEGMLAVRAYLDNTLNGNEIRFLGPQFSILQNLDFDGDTEFIKFLGNGGLAAKDEVEHELTQKQFNYMNKYNTNIFADSLEDSVKSYSYNDEALFKAALLKDLQKGKYEEAVKDFKKVLVDEDRKWFEELATKGTEEEKEAGKQIQNILIAHSKQLKQQFAQFDVEMGSSMTNQDMIKAAIQARIGKEFIGNYSKPNLEIRNAMTYMLSLSKEGSDTEKELLEIKDLLFYIAPNEKLGQLNVSPNGILTLTEQLGIDTKHVHDAANIYNSSAWRVGVHNLFKNANGATGDKLLEGRQKAVSSLVEGATKVFFANSKLSRDQITEEIINTTREDFINQIEKIRVGRALEEQKIEVTEDAIKKALESGIDLSEIKLDNNEEILGKLYIRSLYDLSGMENAYKGYYNSFRGQNPIETFNYIYNLSGEDKKDFEDAIAKRSDLGKIQEKIMFNARFSSRTNITDEALNVFNRALKEGDILAYQTDNGVIGAVLTKRNGRSLTFEEFNFNTGKTTGVKDTFSGISIKDLNEQIKKRKGKLLDYHSLDIKERNVNLRNIGNFSSDLEFKEAYSKYAAELSMETRLNDLFDNVNSPNFKKEFENAINQTTRISVYNPAKFGTLVSNIAGNDAEAFARRVNDINARIQYGIDSGMITGSTDAKELTRAINKKIAKNPNHYKNKISGDNAYETVKNYLEDEDSINIRDDRFLRFSAKEIELSNKIADTIDNRISKLEKSKEQIAQKFYNDITDNEIEEEKAFDRAKRNLELEVKNTNKTVFDSIRLSKNKTNQEEMLLRRFGWDDFQSKDFLIIPKNDKIDNIGKAKVGYGTYIGTNISDLYQTQQENILKEIEVALPTLEKDSLEYFAAVNTKTLLTANNNRGTGIFLDFSNAETLRTSYRGLYNPDIIKQAANEEALERARKEAINASQKAINESIENSKKKTLFGGIKNSITDSIKNLTPENKSLLKMGGLIGGGLAATGIIGHALFNNSSDDDVEVPVDIQNSSKGTKNNISHKIGTEYDSQPTLAKQSSRPKQRKIAPPSVKRNRTIYHDAGSGFDFKVSAQSYNKLQSESYQRISQNSGVNGNTSLNISRDNSKITDNWLQNKFAQFTE